MVSTTLAGAGLLLPDTAMAQRSPEEAMRPLADIPVWKRTVLALPDHPAASGAVNARGGSVSFGTVVDGLSTDTVCGWQRRLTLYGRLTAHRNHLVTDANRRSVAVGYAESSFDHYAHHGFILKGDAVTALALPAKPPFVARPTGINNRGDIVGMSGERLCRWNDAHPGVIELVTLPPLESTVASADIDQDGTVYLTTFDQSARPASSFRLTNQGTIVPLTAPAGFVGRIKKVHHGWIAGLLINGAGAAAAVWRPDGTIMLAPDITSFLAINRVGLAVGRGADRRTILVWRGGRVVGRIIEPAGEVLNVAGISDDGIAFGSYRNSEGRVSPTHWSP